VVLAATLDMYRILCAFRLLSRGRRTVWLRILGMSAALWMASRVAPARRDADPALTGRSGARPRATATAASASSTSRGRAGCRLSCARSIRRASAVVDYAGQTVELVDRRTGEIGAAQVFVPVLGASSYTYADATLTQTPPDWIGAHVRALACFGGVPRLPDNLQGRGAECRRRTGSETGLKLTYYSRPSRHTSA